VSLQAIPKVVGRFSVWPLCVRNSKFLVLAVSFLSLHRVRRESKSRPLDVACPECCSHYVARTGGLKIGSLESQESNGKSSEFASDAVPTDGTGVR
jgi:hypothetical protein